ncbi:MAG TPA: ABC transporter permease [Candidatus Methylomirabilis sp.]|nr:ABC transporter permease [Candidatus Methylomirabilis sp.]
MLRRTSVKQMSETLTTAIKQSPARKADRERALVQTPERESDRGRPTLVIRPSRGWVALNLVDLWQYRELIYFLTWRDIRVRYKQTALGAAWAVIQPLFTMIVFSIFFGRLAKIPSDGLPYPIFAYCALLPWQLFAHSLTESSNSLVANQHLITKVYFPRLVIPISTVLAGLLDFLIAFVFLIGMMIYYGMAPTAVAWTVPLFVLLALGTALGVGLWLSALNVQYRDVRYAIPFLTQLWLFATPIAYPSSLIPGPWRTIYGLNPMAGVVEGFRWALLGTGNPPGGLLLVSVAATLIVLLSGLYYFRRMEKTFADMV